MITESEAKLILEPHHKRLAACVYGAWERWQVNIAPHIPVPYPRGRANILYELMADEARQCFDGVGGIRIVEGTHRLLLAVGDRLVVRFKKLSDSFETANFPTQAPSVPT